MNSKVVKTEEVSKENICEALREYCNAKGVSQRVAATKIGVSDATINNVLTGKWNVISEEMWRKIWNAVGTGNKEPLFNTADHLAIKKLCSTARKNRLMIGLTGDTGMGKTRSLESIKRGRNTFYIVYKKTMNARQFLCTILKELGIVFEGNKYDMVNRIAEELNVLTSPLLIIDEAGKLPHTVMQYLHDLRDYTINNCGIVLAGMPYFEENLKNMPGSKRKDVQSF
ncbi:AAA family ATPase [Paraflavitalea speifideaquila]|uniref:AAA family ATPase n=1 Tax=Paraflavitalea speifideaquila TaxID=3076558 RepID=UPI0028EB4D2D|nr:AAA family ATPase [Paraflavitalea speifideiaquila]